jgi:hypothetical protein
MTNTTETTPVVGLAACVSPSGATWELRGSVSKFGNVWYTTGGNRGLLVVPNFAPVGKVYTVVVREGDVVSEVKITLTEGKGEVKGGVGRDGVPYEGYTFAERKGSAMLPDGSGRTVVIDARRMDDGTFRFRCQIRKIATSRKATMVNQEV